MITTTDSLGGSQHLQCPVCLRRHLLRDPQVGQESKCKCGFLLFIPNPEDATTLAPLELSAVPPLCPVPSDWRGRRPRDLAPTRPYTPTTDSSTRLTPTIEPRSSHPVVRCFSEGDTVEVETVELRRLAEKISLESGFDVLRSLPLLRGFHPFDYQVRTARHVLKQLGGRALLADEVGLGKTIEALCILKELHLRRLVKRVLVLTPATLVSQWREEMASKFNLRFQVAISPEDWNRHPLVVGSLDRAKGARHAERIVQRRWDMVVVDEAHRLKNKQTRNWKFVNSIASRYLLLLSATPFQNDLIELYNLVTLLKPGQLETEREFRQRFLVRGNSQKCQDSDALREVLAEVMVRNRRGEVGVKFAPRRGETRRLPMPQQQAELYEAATAFCRSWFSTIYGSTAPLVTVGYMKMLCASPFRFRESLVGNLLPKARELKNKKLIADITALIELADHVREDIKLEALVADLRQHEEKVLIFTHYRGVLRYLAARLKSEKMSVVVFHGGMSAEEKDLSVEQFRGPQRILIATDAGSEGRNLQFCRRIVNYDLPWNPMKIEQRIGRVHRMGQTRDVLVTNYTLQETFEDQLLDMLQRKLGLFRLVVGEVDMILGRLKVERRLAMLLLKSRNETDLGDAMVRFGDELAAMRTQYQRTKEVNRSVLPAVAPGK